MIYIFHKNNVGVFTVYPHKNVTCLAPMFITYNFQQYIFRLFHLLRINLKILIIAMFVLLNIRQMFHKITVAVFMTYLQKKKKFKCLAPVFVSHYHKALRQI
jgi:hypothetical protein